MNKAKPHRAYVPVSVHSPNKWIFKEVAKHEGAVAFHIMHYNFARVHQTLRVTAMEAGVASHVWMLEEIVKLA